MGTLKLASAFDGLAKKPYATVPLEVMQAALMLPSRSKQDKALAAYIRLFFSGEREDVPKFLEAFYLNVAIPTVERMHSSKQFGHKRWTNEGKTEQFRDSNEELETPNNSGNAFEPSQGGWQGASREGEYSHNHTFNHTHTQNRALASEEAMEPPTLEEVEAVFSEQLNDPEQAAAFFEYGEANDWRIPGIEHGILLAGYSWNSSRLKGGNQLLCDPQ